jgi:DNA-directed RNA polymerase alpha subunit
MMMPYTPEEFHRDSFEYHATGRIDDEVRERLMKQYTLFAEQRGMTLEEYLHEISAERYELNLQQCLEQHGDVPLLELSDIPKVTCKALAKKKIRKVSDVITREIDELLLIRNIGKKRLRQLQDSLRSSVGFLFGRTILDEDVERWEQELKEKER